MRNFLVAATMLLGALVITFCTASVLQDAATARVGMPAEPFTVDVAGQATKPFGTKERVGQTRDQEARLASW